MPTKITANQTNRNNLIASTRLDPVIWDSMIKCAELNGYETVSAFVRDCVLEKMSSTAYAMISICKENKTKAFSLNDF